MKAIITAGGKGTRLRPLTFTNNKHLIPIANKPILEYAIETIISAGINDIGIIYNNDLSDLKNFTDSKNNFNVNISFVHQPSPLGLADCVRVSKDFIGKDKFILFLGDNIIVENLKDIKEKFENDKEYNSYLFLTKVIDPQRFGVPIFGKNGEIIGIEEKPKNPKTDLAVTGIYFYDYHVFEGLEGKDKITPSKRGELEISDLHQYLIDHRYKIDTYNITGWWKDTGKINDLLLAQRLILEKTHQFQMEGIVTNTTIEGDVEIKKGSKIKNSFIRGPVVIGENTKIDSSYIGPFSSIGNECILKNCEIENSIILDASSIIDIPTRIDSSLIGKGVNIVKRDRKPKSISLMVGDMADIQLI